MSIIDELNGVAIAFNASEIDTARTSIAGYLAGAFAVGLIPSICGMTMVLARCKRLGCSSRNAAGVSPERTKSRRSSFTHTVLTSLADSQSSAERLRLRVSGIMGQLGLLMLLVVIMRIFVITSIMSPVLCNVAVGDGAFWLPMMPIGMTLLMLAVLPTDQRLISVLSCVVFAILLAVSIIIGKTTSDVVVGLQMLEATLAAAPAFMHPQLEAAAIMPRTAVVILAICTSTMAICTVLMAPALRCGLRAMQPRLRLRRIWLCARLAFLGMFLLTAVSSLVLIALGLAAPAWENFAESFGWLLCSFLSSRSNRGRAHLLLHRLGSSTEKEQAAAAVAALVGNSSSTSVLTLAQTKFRVLPYAELREIDLADSRTARGSRSLYTVTKQAALGSCTFFVSHSWRDDGSCKWRLLQSQCTAFEQEHPDTGGCTLWIGMCPTSSHPSVL